MDISGAPPLQTPRRIMAPAPRGNGACTHMTMTRLYTDTLRCTNCKQLGSFGWLLKCTQDTEFTYEDELERGVRTSQLDKYCEIFDLSTAPKKRGPAARTASRLSFLDEISDEALKTYTPEQLKRVLDQRAHCQDVAQAAYEEIAADSGLQILFSDYASSQTSDRWSQSSSPDRTTNPWVTSKECFYKICSKCRRSYMDRTWLSMDAVAEGELPLTAVMGHGFHYRLGKQRRPVAPNRLVNKLGMRPVPLIGPNAVLISLAPPELGVPDLETRRRQLFPHLFADEEPFEDSFAIDENIITQSGTQAPAPVRKAYTCSPEVEEILQRLDMDPQRQHPQSHSRSSSYSVPVSLRQQYPETLTPPHSSPPSPSTPDNEAEADGSLQQSAASTPPTPPTPMEQTEEVANFFSSAPLEVNSGVAVTEEGVELHVPDIVLDDHWLRENSS